MVKIFLRRERWNVPFNEAKPRENTFTIAQIETFTLFIHGVPIRIKTIEISYVIRI